MIKAWELYGSAEAVVLFIVEDVTYNICDQKFHEFEIRRQNPDVFVLRKSLTQMASEARLDGEKRLWVGDKEVAVVYFRCGYSPDQYPTEDEWEARLTIERSKAVKSPSIHLHLAGTKKVQQELAKKGVLRRFLEPDQAESVESIFTGLYSLDFGSPEADRALEMAVKAPEKFVVKPQREGGGNNVYGKDIPAFLNGIKDSEERNAYILMDRIEPPRTMNYLVRPGGKSAQPDLTEVISELGVFGYIIGSSEEVMSNEQVGHMLRTKLSNVDEGGVAAGSGALDSVYLVDDN